MFSEYKAEVVAAYKKKRDNASLSLPLIKPTPAGLKKECLLVLETRTTRDDFKTLRYFFGERNNIEDYEVAIMAADIDKFRPLQKFMKGETGNPDDGIIELLAWLIDFRPRPYRLGFTRADIVCDPPNNQTDKANPVALSPEDSQGIYGGSAQTAFSKVDKEGPVEHQKVKVRRNKKQLILVFILLILGAIGLTVNQSNISQSLSPFGKNDQCMYWNGDRYIQVACETRFAHGQVLALDKFKLEHFRKITRTDTLTQAHINKVWYSKANNKIEVYTADGNHPEQLHKRLRPLSKYMFDKYVFKKEGMRK